MGSEARGRVLCVTSTFPRWEGDSTTPFVLNLAQDLQALGWSIDVLAPHAPGAAMTETLHGVPVQRFRYLWPEALETICYQGGALVNLRRNPLDKLKLPFFVFSEWVKLLGQLRRDKYDVLHSHWILPQGFTGVLAAIPMGIPHIATVHGSDVIALNGPILDLCKRFTLRYADAVTVNSSATRQATLRLVPGIQKLHTIPMGVSAPREPDPSTVSALRARYRRGRGPLLVFAGRIVFEKGIEDLISAIGLLESELPEATALIVGDGQDRNAAEAAARTAGLENKIAFSGWVAPENLPNYLAAGDIFVGPSWFEAQGLAFAEAMLAGTPVIATNVGGVSDTVRHEVTGLLVRERAPREIATAVIRLVQDSALAQRLAAAGSAHVRAHFLRGRAADSFSKLLKNVIAGHASKRATTKSCTQASREEDLGARQMACQIRKRQETR